jgi:hypothetical protein
MAEPVDYFLQGANLGMRAAQFGTQTRQADDRMAEQRRQFDLSRGDQNEQFRTNFAERSRQFELNRKIALDELELRNKEYTLRQENAIVNQSLQLAQLYKSQFESQEMMRKANEAKQFAPIMSSYSTKLSNWNGEGSPPAEPANLPKELREEATAMRFNAISVASNDRSLKLQYEAQAASQKRWNDGLEYMTKFKPESVTFNQDTNTFSYDWNEYTELRASDARQAKRLSELKLMAEVKKLLPPDATEREQKWAEENAVKFYTPGEMGELGKFDTEGFKQGMNAAMNRPKLNGPPPLTEESSFEDILNFLNAGGAIF